MVLVSALTRTFARMDIRHIEYFVLAVEEGTLSGSAQRCHVSTQAVSKAIAALEREMGAPLLVRDAFGVYPTVLGTRVLESGRELMGAFGKLRDAAQEGRDAPTLTVALGAPPFLGSHEICDSFSAYLSSALSAQVECAVVNGADAMRTLREGAADCLVSVGRPERADLTHRLLGRVPASVVVAPDHPLCEGGSVTVKDLGCYPMLSHPKQGLLSDAAVRALRRCGLRPEVVDNADEGEMRARLAAGQGFALSIAREDGTSFFPGTRALPLVSGEASVQVPLYVSELKGREHPLVAQLPSAFAHQTVMEHIEQQRNKRREQGA